MQIRRLALLISLPLAGGAVATALDAPHVAGPDYTSAFGLEHVERLVPDGASRFVSLRPGRFLRHEGVDGDGAFVEIETTVLDRVRRVDFVVNGRRRTAETRVVEEREWIDGGLAQVSWNYFALDERTGDVYGFGEDVTHFDDGVPVDHDGSWLAGRDGAQPGLLMPGSFLLGSRYAQELAPGRAMDRAEHLETGLVIETPAGVFGGCVTVLETTPLEPDEEVIKAWAPGVGVVIDDYLTLVEFGG